jgi:hypothetical protein
MLLVKAAHTAEVNCGPQSEVSKAGTPNLATHPATSAAAQSSAMVFRNGTASHQRVDLSTMVSK